MWRRTKNLIMVAGAITLSGVSAEALELATNQGLRKSDGCQRFTHDEGIFVVTKVGAIMTDPHGRTNWANFPEMSILAPQSGDRGERRRAISVIAINQSEEISYVPYQASRTSPYQTGHILRDQQENLANIEIRDARGEFTLRAAQNENGEFEMAHCEGRDYQVFNMTDHDGDFQVGISEEETEILADVVVSQAGQFPEITTRAGSAPRASQFHYVVCHEGRSPLFDADDYSFVKWLDRGTELLPAQSFDYVSPQLMRYQGGVVDFKMVQVADEPETIGWIQETSVRLASECDGVELPALNFEPPASENQRSTTEIEHPEWGLFPLNRHAQSDFQSGTPSFGRSRSGGRKHAAVDLYTPRDEPFYAVADGVIIQEPTHFYLGTYSIVVRHVGGYVVRYGEIHSSMADGLRLGSRVVKGQKLGRIKKIQTDRCCRPMLHFELFEGTFDSALTNEEHGHNCFKRREDIMDPTRYMMEWEVQKFGTNAFERDPNYTDYQCR